MVLELQNSRLHYNSELQNSYDKVVLQGMIKFNCYNVNEKSKDDMRNQCGNGNWIRANLRVHKFQCMTVVLLPVYTNPSLWPM